MERHLLLILGLIVLISTGCIQSTQNSTTTTQITDQQNPTTTIQVTTTTQPVPFSHLGISKDVELVTDKTSYSLGETITIRIRNTGTSTVSYEIPVGRPLNIPVLKEGAILRISEPSCLSVPALSGIEIPPNTTSTLLTWNQKHYVGCNLSNCQTGGDLECEYVQASKGKYALLFAITKEKGILEKIEKDIWILNQDCISRKTEEYGLLNGFLHGHLYVKFTTDLNKTEIQDLIGLFLTSGLHIESYHETGDGSYLVLLTLPVNEEIDWMCILEEEDSVESTNLVPEVGIPGKNSKPKKVDWGACESDSDCIIVNENHCSCGNSGTRTSINKEFKVDWEGKIKNESEGLGCYTVESSHWTCGEVVSKCVNNTCKLLKIEYPAEYNGPNPDCDIGMNKTECLQQGFEWNNIKNEVFPEGYCSCPGYTV